MGSGLWVVPPGATAVPAQLPSRPLLSPECRDLLQRLLERDPSKRISFEEFFAHPFVDMEHVPGPESFCKAVSGGVDGDGMWWDQTLVLSPHYLQTNLVVEAVKKDQEGDASAALSLYCKALEYFVPALHCESPRS